MNLHYPGPIKYYANGWKNYTAPMELLPLTYPFKFNGVQTNIAVSGCSMDNTVVILSLKGHAVQPLAGGTARPGIRR